MSDVTLHGYPVNVGDMVWSIERGWVTVARVGEATFMDDSGCWFNHLNKTAFWQPIDPDAIEAAKVKPKPVEYEWQWLYICEAGYYETTGFVKGDGKPSIGEGEKLLNRIEESKREVKP